MSATAAAAGMKRARPHDCSHFSAVEDASSSHPRARSLGMLQQHQHQLPYTGGHLLKHDAHLNRGNCSVGTYMTSAAKLNRRPAHPHHAPSSPASFTLHLMYQPFLRQVAAGMAAGMAATTAVDSDSVTATADGGSATAAMCCSGAAELLLPQLASQGVDVAAFLQPMVQMVASLTAGDSNSSSAAGASADRARTSVGGTALDVGVRAAAAAAADAAATWEQQGASVGAGLGAARQGGCTVKSRVPLFSSTGWQLAAQEQLAAACPAAAAAAAVASGRTATPASTASAMAAAPVAAVQDAARWDEAYAVQWQRSSASAADLVRASSEPGAGVFSNQPQLQQHQGEAACQHQVQPYAGPASPDLPVHQQQLQMQQGSWMTSSSSSGASSSAAGGAPLEGLMSPIGRSPASTSALPHQHVVAAVAAQGSRQCSSSAVPSYTAGDESQVAAARATGSDAVRAASEREEWLQHTQQVNASISHEQPRGAAEHSAAAVRAAPGPAASQAIDRHRQHILMLEQQLGNLHPQVGKAYVALAALLYQEGSAWSLSMASRAQQRAAHIMQGMQQAAAAASLQAVQAQPAAQGSACGRIAAKGISMQQGGAAAYTALAAAAAAGDVADAVVRVVARQPALSMACKAIPSPAMLAMSAL